jgi:FkbM family methyltransferase
LADIRKPVRISIISIYIALALAVFVIVGAAGVMVGIKYKTYQLLFELRDREALKAAIRQVLGLQKTYAEKQQDLWIVLSVVPGKRDGYYVDVGSGDGEFVSNTKLLDDMGWKGVCIDPFPTNMSSRTCQLFRQPVFSVSGKKVSFRAAGMLGGITETLGAGSGEPAVQKAPLVDFSTATLDEILEKAHAPRHIDFMSIDIEGAEYEALRGLSLDKYEVQAFDIEHNNEEPKRQLIRQLLETNGYTLVRSWYRDDFYVLHDLPYQFKLVLEHIPFK